jgi:hypothetical protein
MSQGGISWLVLTVAGLAAAVGLQLVVAQRFATAILVALSLLLGFAIPQHAVAYDEIVVEKTCPYDGTKFKSREAISGSSFDKGLDMMPIGAIAAPWPMASCPTNGFVFLKQEYSNEELERLRPLIFSPEFRALKEETPYYRGAWVMEHTGEAHAKVSEMLLQATWEAREEPDRYKRYATQLVTRLPEDIAAENGENKFTFQLLYVELLRRLGRFDEAMDFLGKLENLPVGAAPIVAFEKELVAKRDTAPHTMKEAQKDNAQ